MQQYFNKFLDSQKKDSGFLFFKSIVDENKNTRMIKVKKIISNFMNKNLKIPKITTNEFLDEIAEERPSKRIGGIFKYCFEPFIENIYDSNIDI